MSLFPHNEYHIYTTAADIERRYVHLTNEELAQAEYLHTFVHKKAIQDNDWQHTSKLRVADNVWLIVGDGMSYLDTPRLISYGYEGPETCPDGDFEESVHFDTMIFYECTTRPGSNFEPSWDIDAVRNWVKPPHREKFDQTLQEYLDESERVLVL